MKIAEQKAVSKLKTYLCLYLLEKNIPHSKRLPKIIRELDYSSVVSTISRLDFHYKDTWDFIWSKYLRSMEND